MPSVFFFNDTATTEIYTLSLHDALPISLAAKLVPDKTLADLRQMIEHDIEHGKQHDVERAKETQILKYLHERIQFDIMRSEEHTSELQSHLNLVCRLLLEKKNINKDNIL